MVLFFVFECNFVNYVFILLDNYIKIGEIFIKQECLTYQNRITKISCVLIKVLITSINRHYMF